MVERITGPTPTPSCRHAVGRLADGDTVPHRLPTPAPTRYEWRVFWLTLAVVALGVLLRVLR